MSHGLDASASLLTKYSVPTAIALIVAASLAVYAQTFGFDLINIDDRAYVYENAAVLSGLNSRSIYWALTAFHSANWHPVTWLSHMLDVQLFGTNYGLHHATSVLFHTICGVLAFFVFRQLTGRLWQGAVIALLFVVHPTHVESVAWVAERRDVLSTMFWLLTMLAYFRYATTESSKAKWYIAVIACFGLGLMSKPMLVTLPFVLLLCDYWSLHRLNKISDLKGLVIEKLPLFALTIISSIITFYAQASAGATVSLKTLSVGDRILNAATSYGKYVVMMFYPKDLGLWYPMDESPDQLKVIGFIAIIAGISTLCWFQRKERRYLMMGWLWFLGTLIPVIGLVQVGLQSLADRYTYIPYFGLFIMLVCGLSELAARFRINAKVLAAVSAIVIIALIGVAHVQASYWRNSETLYTHTLGFTKNNHFLMVNLCLHHVKRSPAEIAERQCSELLANVPPTPDGYNVLGILRSQVGKLDDAADFFEKGLKISPDWGILSANLSMVRSKKGQLVEAESAMKRAVASTDGSVSKTTLARLYNEYGAGLEKVGKIAEARSFYEKAVAADPTFPDTPANIERISGK